nr:unconventional prefoldin RPB5 interactor 1-like [Pocillopora verrucosa]
MSEFAQISRFKEENKRALLERQQRLLTCERFKEDYEKLEALLQTLPNKTSHEVMVPFGSVAFMPGRLIHTNEIMVLLGDNWFAERSASQALEMVERRKKYLEKNIAGIKEDLKNFESAVNFASEIQSVAEENADVREIKEELSSQEEERFSTQHLRKAHPKAERFGGTKKVQGLKSDQKDTVTMKGNKVQKVSSEDLSLLARLDELEEKETKNAELDQVGKDDSGDEKSITTGEHTNIQGDARWGLHHKDKTNETEDDDENHDSDDLQTTISVKFSSSSEHSQGQSPKDSCEELTVTSPADIYSQFASKKELKSILRRPSAEEKDKKNFEEETSLTTQQFPSDIVKDNTQIADFDSQKAFTGSIIEKPAVQMIRQESSHLQSGTSQPGKKLSRFKATRQKQQ